MAKWLQRLRPKSAFARGVGVLVGGTAGAQLLMVIASPLLTRLYSPTDFGLLAVFTAILALFAVIAAGRYELAIPLPEEEQDAANLTVLGFVLIVITSLISLLVFLLWPTQIAALLNAPELAPYLWLIPFGVFFLGSYQLFNKWTIRQKQFSAIARTRIVQALGTLAMQLGAYKLGVVALLGGQAAGQGLGASSLALSALRRPEFRQCTLAGVRLQASRYRKFPLYSTWTGLLNTASLQFAPIVFIALYGAAVAGLYALTLRILSMPVTLIGNALGSVFLSSAPEARRNGTLKELVSKLHARLAMAGALPLVVLLFFGPDLFEFVFGAEWRKAGQYAQWMAPWIYLQLQWSPLSTLSSVLELQRQSLISEALVFTIRFGTLLICASFGLSADLAIFIFAVVSAILYLALLLWFTRAAGVAALDLIASDIKYLFLAAAIVVPAWLLAEYLI